MTVPLKAIQAAAEALRECNIRWTKPIDADITAATALEAAAPAIAAAERDRIRQLALTARRLAVQSPVAAQALREFADLLDAAP